MSLSLVQFRDPSGARGVAALESEGGAYRVSGVELVVELARKALAAGTGLAEAVAVDPIDTQVREIGVK